MKRLLREPLLHFALLGGLLYALQPFLSPAPSIEVSLAEQSELRLNWQRQTGRAPGPEEMTALINQHIDELLLLKEAHRLGLHERDPVVRQRLVRNMRFALADSSAGEDGMFSAAVTLGMAHSDLVVRRRLLQLMRHQIESQATVSEALAQDYFAAHSRKYQAPARYSFEQVYFKSPRPGEVAAALNALKLGHDAKPVGSPFLLGNNFKHRSYADIELQLGADIAQLVSSATPGQWFGPVQSAYGTHLIRVQHRQAEGQANYRQTKKQLVADLYRHEESRQLRETLQSLRRQYRLSIEGQPS